jgi:hypothetical protein
MIPQKLSQALVPTPGPEGKPFGAHGIPAGGQAYRETGPPQVDGQRLHEVWPEATRRRISMDAHLENRPRDGRGVGDATHHALHGPGEPALRQGPDAPAHLQPRPARGDRLHQILPEVPPGRGEARRRAMASCVPLQYGVKVCQACDARGDRPDGLAGQGHGKAPGDGERGPRGGA